jgi:hypothetical protein
MPYSADTLHCSTRGTASLCGSPLGRHKRTEQRRTDSSLVLINIEQAGFLQQNISWSSPVSSSERHLSVRKFGTNSPSLPDSPPSNFHDNSALSFLTSSLPTVHHHHPDHSVHCDVHEAAGVRCFHILMKNKWDSSDHSFFP